MTSASRSIAKARSPLPIPQGVLPLDPARVPVDVIANATSFTAEIMDLAAADPPLTWLVLAASAMGDTRGVTFALSDVDPVVLHLLDAYGLTDRIGVANIYPTTRDAVEAYQRTTATES